MRKHTLLLTQSAVLAALTCLLTSFVHLPLPVPQGYVHLGDAAIFFGALLLGPACALAAGVGSALADLLGGYAVYALPTFIIKALMGYIAGRGVAKAKGWHWAVVFVLAGCVMSLGYFLYEWVLYGWASALAALGPNLVQGMASAGLGIVSQPLARRVKAMVSVR